MVAWVMVAMLGAPTADDAYDAGVTQLAAGQTPSAIASLLVARDLAPRDREIATALSAARERAGSVQRAPEPWPVSAQELSLGVLACVVALSGAWAARARHALTGAIAATLLLVAALRMARQSTQPDYAVVLSAETTAHVADDASSMVRFTLHQGDEIEVERMTDAWVRVRSADGTRAYVERAKVVVTARD